MGRKPKIYKTVLYLLIILLIPSICFANQDKYKVTIRNVEETKVGSVTIAVLDKDGNQIETHKITSQEGISIYLPEGTFFLKQIEGVEGYKLNSILPIEIKLPYLDDLGMPIDETLVDFKSYKVEKPVEPEEPGEPEEPDGPDEPDTPVVPDTPKETGTTGKPPVYKDKEDKKTPGNPPALGERDKEKKEPEKEKPIKEPDKPDKPKEDDKIKVPGRFDNKDPGDTGRPPSHTGTGTSTGIDRVTERTTGTIERIVNPKTGDAEMYKVNMLIGLKLLAAAVFLLVLRQRLYLRNGWRG